MQLGGKGDPLRTVKEIKILTVNKKNMHSLESVLENETHEVLWDFEIQTGHQITVKIPELIIVNKIIIERTCWIVDLTILADHWVKIKRKLKGEISIWTLTEPKKLCNTKVKVITIVIDALGTILLGIVKGSRGLEIGWQAETIQTTALLRSARILRRSWRLEETCCHSGSSERQPGKTTALIRSDRILRRSWRLEETCCHSGSNERQPGKTTALLRSDRILRRLLETWRDLLSFRL